jgi:DNA-damage-inducible protein J
MTQEASMRVSIDPKLKAEVEDLFEDLGITTTETITLFYRQVKLGNGLPFDRITPNKVTERVFENTDAGENLVSFDAADQMFEQLGL